MKLPFEAFFDMQKDDHDLTDTFHDVFEQDQMEEAQMEIASPCLIEAPTTFFERNIESQSLQPFIQGLNVDRNHTQEFSPDQCLALPSLPNKNPWFVNAYVIVDPLALTITLPKQVLTYTVNGKSLSSICESKVLHECQKESRVNMSPNSSSVDPIVGGFPSLLASFSSQPTGNKESDHDDRIKVSAVRAASSLTSNMNQSNFDGTLSSGMAGSILLKPKPANPNEVFIMKNNIECCGDLTPPVPTHYPPVKALTAYNFFFRDERDAMIHGTKFVDRSFEKRAKLLRDHWYQDRTVKRRHRKTHGKIDFATLSRTISAKWKALPKAEKQFYRDIAMRDLQRYRQDMEHFAVRDSVANPAIAVL